ncbi:DUF6923 family protein, partial [Actinokineospora spheciospongiae]|uniref:DUF6923 family protein n=1 Tax=Actinokineospora spheciospongiae TaxID=909613 RepID=UPI00054D5768
MRRPQAVLSAIAVSTVLAGTALLTADPDPVLLTAGPPAPADCTFFRVTNSGHGLSTLSSIDLAAGTATRVRTLEFRAAALGYANGRIYALTDEGFHPTSRLITMDTTGKVLSTTPLRDTAHGGFGIRGGAVANGHFHAIAGTTLLSIRLSDAVVDARVHLSLSGITVDDLAHRPADGRLYGVSTPVLFPGQGRAVRIDPATGSVTQTGQNPLPVSTSYGSVVLAPDGALYPVSNRTNGRSRVYRLPLTPGGSPTETLVLPPADSADASECVPRPAPPTTPP